MRTTLRSWKLIRRKTMRVAVVGAGIMGASSAYHLARRGIEVHLFDLAPGPAEGVTHNAFGWVNTINGDPCFEEAYMLRVRAVKEYESLLSDMPELLTDLRRGSLVWKKTPESTASFATQHRAHGNFDLATSSSIAAKEPRLKKLPGLAIYSPLDIAINPAVLTRVLIARAERLGTNLHYSSRVNRLELTGQSVTGIQTESGLLSFDLVVLAAGSHTGSLLEGIVLPLGVETSPVVLLRYRTKDQLLCNILSFPELEIRQATDRTVLVVEDFYSGCEEINFSTLRLRVKDVLHEYFVMPGDFEFSHGAVGHRPMFSDGLPRRGFAQHVNGLYLLVGHPGIILAPLLSRLAAEEIVSYHS